MPKIYFTDANLEYNPLDSLDDSKFLEDMEGKWINVTEELFNITSSKHTFIGDFEFLDTVLH